MRERAAAGDEEVDDVVEARRVAPLRADDRLEVGEVLAEGAAREERLARGHPVLVAAERVDLAVVGDAPVGVGAVPRGERVRAEARVDEGERAAHVVLAEVEVEAVDPLREHEPLVNDGLRRTARDVEVPLRPRREARDEATGIVVLTSRPARLRIMKSTRSNAAAGHIRAMKSCFITGRLLRATGPSTPSSTGTSRQPMTFWLW